MNCRRFGLKTPCATGELKCHDFNSPRRLCNGMMVHLRTFGGVLGKTSMVSTHETLQYDNYDLYVGDYKLELKRQINRDVFPQDCKNAFAMGKKLAE